TVMASMVSKTNRIGARARQRRRPPDMTSRPLRPEIPSVQLRSRPTLRRRARRRTGRPGPEAGATADLLPEGLVAAGDPAAGGEHGQGGAVDGHLLDQGQGGDGGGGAGLAAGGG